MAGRYFSVRAWKGTPRSMLTLLSKQAFRCLHQAAWLAAFRCSKQCGEWVLLLFVLLRSYRQTKLSSYFYLTNGAESCILPLLKANFNVKSRFFDGTKRTETRFPNRSDRLGASRLHTDQGRSYATCPKKPFLRKYGRKPFRTTLRLW